MLFSEQTYSVLVVSSASKFNDILRQMLPGSDYYPVTFVSNAAQDSRGMDLLAQRNEPDDRSQVGSRK